MDNRQAEGKSMHPAYRNLELEWVLPYSRRSKEEKVNWRSSLGGKNTVQQEKKQYWEDLGKGTHLKMSNPGIQKSI